jgi:hypothetical protein
VQTWRAQLSEFGDTLGGHDQGSLKTIIKRVRRCTWSPYLSEDRGRNRASFDESLRAATGWWTGR